MFKNRSESNNLKIVKIYFLPNRLHINLKEAIQILNKPYITESIECCTQIKPQSGEWYIYIEYNNELNKISDGIEWVATGTTMLPNKKHPMLIAEYFSSENIYKSVFKLKKKNKYNASLVNYTNNPLQLDSPNGEIEKCKAHVARKKSIKSIMKRRFGKRNTTESATQNSGNL